MAEPWVVKPGVKFFRREDWHLMQPGARPPVWHRFKELKVINVAREDRLGNEYTERRWVWKAECGYELKLDLLQTAPMQRADVKTKSKRCARCDARAARSAARKEEKEAQDG